MIIKGKIKKITKTNSPRRTYDIGVADNHNFFANNILIHNCQHDATTSMVHIHTKTESKVVLGLSATPYRTDRLKLPFQKIIKDAGIHRLIQEGWLSKYHHYCCESYSPESIATLYMASPDRWDKSVVFFHTINECERFASILAREGHWCEVVTGSTNRDKQLDEFDEGKYKVVANVAILMEGFDCPDLRTIFVRDASKIPTIQMAGRGFRIHPDKDYCNIIQSNNTKWNFAKTAKASKTLVEKEGKWYTLGANDKVNETAREVARKLVTIDVVMPTFLVRRRKKKKIA